MRVLTFGSELLTQKAKPVKKIGPEYIKVAEDLLEVLRSEKGIGLAAPQLGIMERIFATEVNGDSPRIFINPSIIETSEETLKYEEGCLSVPGIYADVIRPRKIKVQAWNEKGRPFNLEAAGVLARVILHEYDHLEGMLFIDRLPEEKRKRIIAKIEKSKKNEKNDNQEASD